MSNFVYFLRALATALITNSHYSDIWPSSSLATGGLLGNVIFFAVSGYCLYNVQGSFIRWYVRRFLKVYPIVAGFTAFTVIIGAYSMVGLSDFVKLFVFPTNYIFIAWLLVLYIPFYFVAKLDKTYDNTLKHALFCIAISWLTIYLIFIDKSVYCVDDVNSPFIMFLYFASMLMGALLKKHSGSIKDTSLTRFCALIISLGVYFGSKIVFSRADSLLALQPLNQLFLFLALFFLFTTAMGLEGQIKRMNKAVISAVRSISSVTLHIYIVQFVIIHKLSKLIFPLNLLVVTALILVCAFALYYLERFIRKSMLLFAKKLDEKKVKK